MKDLKKLDCLFPNTKKLLLQMMKEYLFSQNYAFVSGSALTLYLCHRKSEDLGFLLEKIN